MKKNTLYIFLGVLMLLCGCEQIPEFRLPEVRTLEASKVTKNSVVLNAYFSCDTKSGLYVKRVFEFSNSEDNLNSNRYYFDKEWTELAGVHENTVSMDGLQPSTTYYFRAGLLPRNASYSAPIYGETLSFTTASNPKPEVTVTTEEVTSVTSTTARTSGTCSAKNTTLSEMGILISTSTPTPTISNNDGKSKFTNSTNFRTFWYELTPNKKYYFRAYAVDKDGNAYYGAVKEFTTKSEPGGSLTKEDFVGTYNVTAFSPWESKNVSWNDVEIIPDAGDTVIAIGWNGRDEFRAVGIFDKGMQVVRFESSWYYESLSFDVNGYTCVALFTPTYYNATDQKAYRIETGGKGTVGEIWLSQTSANNYSFGPCDGDSNEGYYANGFIFDYYTTSDWVQHGNSNVYMNVKMERTSSTTTKNKPARQASYLPVIQNIKQRYETQITDNSCRATAAK